MIEHVSGYLNVHIGKYALNHGWELTGNVKETTGVQLSNVSGCFSIWLDIADVAALLFDSKED